MPKYSQMGALQCKGGRRPNRALPAAPMMRSSMATPGIKGRKAMELGYIGLGNMGGALARRLLREHKMRVFDLRPEIVARFADSGGVPTQSAQALARESDMVMTCLPSSAEVRDVLFGEGRVAEALRPGQIFADMTTGD